jgi:hypothetical protein
MPLVEIGGELVAGNWPSAVDCSPFDILRPHARHLGYYYPTLRPPCRFFLSLDTFCTPPA